ncbi:MAG: TlpA family protein disulfide reductase [Thermodesulfovibrionales bacterium]|nr:TlpA family protein disulfide reductase [Thermodesulfovibrionales bacterium]
MTTRLLALLLLSMVFLYGLYGCSKEPAVKIGQRAPDIRLNALDGKSVSIPGDLKGDVVVMLFWAEGCSYCEKDMPNLEAAYKDLKGQGFEFVAVQVGGEAEVSTLMLEKNGITFSMLHDPNSIVRKRFGIRAVPTMFFLDSQGRITEKILGGLNSRMLREIVQEKLG